MPREQLQALAADMDRLLAAGAAAAAGDEGLRRRARTLEELGQKVPALARIAQAVRRVLDAAPKQAAAALLDLLLVVRQARGSLAGAGAAGDLEPAAANGPWASATPGRDAYALAELLAGPSSGENAGILEQAAAAGTVADLRLAGPLLATLNSGSSELARAAAAHALPRFGRPLVPELVRALDLGGKQTDARRLEAVCAIDGKVGLELCRKAIAGGSKPVRTQALTCLAALDPAEAERHALAVLSEKLPLEVRNAALRALGGSMSDAALDTLLAVLEAEHGWEPAYGAFEALAKLKHPQTTRRLLQLLERLLAERAAAKKIRKKGKAAASKGSTEEKDYQLYQLLSILAERGAREEVSAVLGVLRSPDADARTAAVRALNDVGPAARASVPDLLALLPDANPTVRAAAARALGNIGATAKPAVPALAAALKDKVKLVRAGAAGALGEIGPEAKEAVPVLVEAAGREKDVWTRYSMVRSLGEFGPAARAAVPLLTKLLKDRSWCLRDSAQRALAQIEGG